MLDEHCDSQESTASFADWVTSFIRRVIQLLENLPEEGSNGTAGGTTEGTLVALEANFRISQLFLQYKWSMLLPTLVIKYVLIYPNPSLTSSST